MLNIGDKIKELRKKQNITQEKLAAYLNVSYQAVSKWEHDMALPDVTLIPQIANFFGVTADELLGMKDVEASEELKRNEKIYAENLRQGKIFDNIVLSREVNEKYPRNYQWMMNQAFALTAYCDTSEHLQYSKEHDFIGEAVRICERVLEDCTIDSIRHSAIQILCIHYPGMGKKELALQYANEMPGMIFCKEFLLSNIYEGEDKVRQYQENLLQMIDMCAGRIHELVYDHLMGKELSVSEKISFLETSNALYHLILPNDENCMLLNLRLWNNYARLAWLWCQAGDADKAMEQLLLAEHAATAFDNDHDQIGKNYKSALVNRCFWNPGSFAKNMEMSERQFLLKRTTDESSFDLLRNREDFVELQKRLSDSTGWGERELLTGFGG